MDKDKDSHEIEFPATIRGPNSGVAKSITIPAKIARELGMEIEDVWVFIIKKRIWPVEYDG